MSKGASEGSAETTPAADPMARKQLRLSFGQALTISILLHAAVVAPFALSTLWPQENESKDTLVVQMDGVLSDSQMDEKKATPAADAVPAAPRPPDAAPPQPAANAVEATQAPPPEKVEASEEPSDAPPPQTAAAEQAKKSETPPQTAPPPPPPQMARPTDEGDVAHSLAPKAEDEDALRKYGVRLAKKVQANLLYPAESRATRAQGVVKVTFALHADGSIDPASLHVIASSGNPGLDAAALATIRNGNPYPPPPKPTSIAFSLSFGKKQ
jgi:periplasmic protein TonB